MSLVLTGCDDASDRYVKKLRETVQTEETEVFVEKDSSEQEIVNKTVQVTEKDEEEVDTAPESNLQTGDNTKKESQVPQIYVQVSGAVRNPGVYQLKEGSRIFQAVELAGGMTEDADIDTINQAQILSDGQMIYVYAVGEQLNLTLPVGQQETGQSQSSSESGKVNLNTATAEELQTLPGIGQSKADIIISYREEYGPFESIEGLMDIPGIKEGVFSKIKDHIKVN